jgi:NAD(P)-dependent dehydrogenase (short-subunit alcohol dehydrogenase family)
VLVPARRPDEARQVLADVDRVEVAELDLSDQDSVAAYAGSLLEEGTHLDIVIGSAGIMATPETHTALGWELQMATNHLGHYALVNRLWPLLAGGARVVSVSSSGHHLSDIRWDDPWFTLGYDKWEAYGQSKTANALFAVHLDALGREHGVRAFSLHPGAILTPLGRHLEADDLEKVMVRNEDGELVLPEFKTPEQGAATSVWAATAPELEKHGGRYLEDVAVAETAPDREVRAAENIGVKAYAQDPVAAARLWAWSARVTGVDAFA